MAKPSKIERFKAKIVALHKNGKSCPAIAEYLKETHGITVSRQYLHGYLNEHSETPKPTMSVIIEELAELKQAMARQEQAHIETMNELRQAHERDTAQIMRVLMELVPAISEIRELRAAAPIVKELPAALDVEAVQVTGKLPKKSSSPRRSATDKPKTPQKRVTVHNE